MGAVRARTIGIWIVLLMLGGCKGQAQTPPQPQVQRLESIDGATLEQYTFQDGNTVYIQTITLAKIAIDQLTGKLDSVKAVPGYYYPEKPSTTSPFFKRVTASEIQASYGTQFGAKIFSVMNASFFEDYKNSTRLSFPIKSNGTVITAGSSPYGPIAKPADSYYRTVKLQALTWNEKTAAIVPYDPKTGAPLNQRLVKNGIVTYAYRDHPAYAALAKDPVNRYQLLGVKDSDPKQPGAEQLLIATSNRTTLAKLAELVKQQGVQEEILTVDGGISTYLYTTKHGNLVLPQPANDEKVAKLPHYLGFRQKFQAQ